MIPGIPRWRLQVDRRRKAVSRFRVSCKTFVLSDGVRYCETHMREYRPHGSDPCQRLP